MILNLTGPTTTSASLSTSPFLPFSMYKCTQTDEVVKTDWAILVTCQQISACTQNEIIFSQFSECQIEKVRF